MTTCTRCLRDVAFDVDDQRRPICPTCAHAEHMSWRAKNGLEDGDDYWHAMNDGWVT